MGTWTGDDHANLHLLSIEDVSYIYDLPRNHARTLVNQHKKRGCKMERSNPYEGPEQEKQTASERRGRVAPAVGMVALNVPEEHLHYHQLLQKALDQDGMLAKATFTSGEHTGYIKNGDNEIEYTEPLKRQGIKFEVKFDTEPQWPLLRQADSKIIRPAKYERRVRPDGYKVALVLPDPQIGYRRYSNGELDPTHDEQAINVAMQLVADLKPELVICLGDLMDLPEMSTKFVTSPEFNQTMELSMFRAHDFLATIRASVPDARIAVLEGNHDRRIFNANNANMAANVRMRQPGGDGWPVLSVPHLANFAKLGIEYVEGYPANALWITEKIKAIHGSKGNSRGSTASAVVSDERVSTIFGHIHRQEVHYKTFDTHDGMKVYGAFSPGCLCRVDGAVPSVKGSTDLQGRPITKFENWQHGIGILEYNPDSGNFSYNNILINTPAGYETRHNGKTYRPN